MLSITPNFKFSKTFFPKGYLCICTSLVVGMKVEVGRMAVEVPIRGVMV